MKTLVLLSISSVLMLACASAPKLDATGVNLALGPQQAATESESRQGERVMWGGAILSSRNLKEVTQFEILAYPLSSNQKPDSDQAPLGRFLAHYPGYLEISDYAQGRLITVSGPLQPPQTGRIGESEYIYPVVQVKQHHLWPASAGGPATRFHLGIGVMFHN